MALAPERGQPEGCIRRGRNSEAAPGTVTRPPTVFVHPPATAPYAASGPPRSASPQGHTRATERGRSDE